MPSNDYQVRFFAAARQSAGVNQAQVQLEQTKATVGDLSASLTDRFGPELGTVLRVSSLLAAGQVLSFERDAQVRLPDTPTMDVLPPFAGG